MAASICDVGRKCSQPGCIHDPYFPCHYDCRLAVWYYSSLLKDAAYLPYQQKERDLQNCNIYVGITLLNVACKVLDCLFLIQTASIWWRCTNLKNHGSRLVRRDDLILAFLVVMEPRQKFRSWILTVCICLKRAFDSVHRETHWYLQQMRGTPARIVGQMTGRWFVIYCEVTRCEGKRAWLFSWTRERFRCVSLPHHFLITLWTRLSRVVHMWHWRTPDCDTRVTGRDFANDAVVLGVLGT